jgi:hypothetical protein
MDRAKSAIRKPITRYPFTFSAVRCPFTLFFATGIAVPPVFFSPILGVGAPYHL